MKNPVIALIVCFAFSCTTTTTDNTSIVVTANEPAAVTGPSPSPSMPLETPSPETKLDKETSDVQDFAGTSGITTRKFDVKGVAVLKTVRAARHPNYDRLVFEFSGNQLPGYHIEYIDKPVRACGSGDVVPLPGDGWLQIRFSPAAAHTDEGKATVGFRSLAPKLPVILEVKSTCDFEAEVEWVAGVSSPNGYRVLELKSPTRLAVDIKHK